MNISLVCYMQINFSQNEYSFGILVSKLYRTWDEYLMSRNIIFHASESNRSFINLVKVTFHISLSWLDFVVSICLCQNICFMVDWGNIYKKLSGVVLKLWQLRLKFSFKTLNVSIGSISIMFCTKISLQPWKVWKNIKNCNFFPKFPRFSNFSQIFTIFPKKMQETRSVSVLFEFFLEFPRFLNTNISIDS